MSMRFWVLGAGCLALICSTGCIRRSLTIRTDPPGASVYINDAFKGETPLTYDFVWYGWHRVLLRKDGFQRIDDRKQLRAPVYFWIPFDFVMELLPFPIHDRREWAYTLTPAPTMAEPVPPAVIKSRPEADAAPTPEAMPAPTLEPTDDTR